MSDRTDEDASQWESIKINLFHLDIYLNYEHKSLK